MWTNKLGKGSVDLLKNIFVGCSPGLLLVQNSCGLLASNHVRGCDALTQFSLYTQHFTTRLRGVTMSQAN